MILHFTSIPPESGKAALRAEDAPERIASTCGGARKGGMTRTNVRRLLVPNAPEPSPEAVAQPSSPRTHGFDALRAAKGRGWARIARQKERGEPKPAPHVQRQAVSPPRRRPSRSCPSCPARERRCRSASRRPRPRSGAAGSLRSRRPRPDTGWRGCPRS